MRLSAAAVYGAAAVIGLQPSKLSLWEYHAMVAGWNEANKTEEDAPPPMSGDRMDELFAQVA